MEIDNSLRLKLVLGSDIPFENSLIKQPTIGKIDIIGEDDFYNWLYPFRLTEDVIELPSEIKGNLNVFDLFILIDEINKLNKVYDKEKSMLSLIESALCFFFDGEAKYYDNGYYFIINNQFKIDRENFSKLSDLLCFICKAEKAKKEKDSFLDNMSEAKRKRYLEHLKRREQYQKKHKSDDGLYKIVNTIVHYQSTVDYDKVKSLTLWQALNSYEVLINKEKYLYNLYLRPHLSEEGSKKLDVKHWSEKFKITDN